MTKEDFQDLVAPVTLAVQGRVLDSGLAADLNERFPATGLDFQAIQAACAAGIAAGWMCAREQGGIRFGRVIKDVGGYSVDVVEMADVAGPHHRHPNGEIDMIMPIDRSAQFDGHGAGWVVYGPDSAHQPTVRGGKALVLYLLPGGAIDFSPV